MKETFEGLVRDGGGGTTIVTIPFWLVKHKQVKQGVTYEFTIKKKNGADSNDT